MARVDRHRGRLYTCATWHIYVQTGACPCLASVPRYFPAALTAADVVGAPCSLQCHALAALWLSRVIILLIIYNTLEHQKCTLNGGMWCTAAAIGGLLACVHVFSATA
jgi:hypothetical protein